MEKIIMIRPLSSQMDTMVQYLACCLIHWAEPQYLLLSNFVKQVLNPPAAEQWVCWKPRTSEKHFSPETETEISSERDFPEYAGRVNWKLNKMEIQFLLMGIFFLKEKIL